MGEQCVLSERRAVRVDGQCVLSEGSGSRLSDRMQCMMRGGAVCVE